MNVPHDEILIPSESFDKGPGPRLREARESAKLSLEEVSTRLHLDRRTIEHLETDTFERLPAPTFVRGYLRSYARLLGLPPGPIIEAFDRRGFEPPALIADIATQSETRTTDFWMLASTVIIVGLLVGLAGIWFANQREEPIEVSTVAPSVPGFAQPGAPESSNPPGSERADSAAPRLREAPPAREVSAEPVAPTFPAAAIPGAGGIPAAAPNAASGLPGTANRPAPAAGTTIGAQAATPPGQSSPPPPGTGAARAPSPLPVAGTPPETPSRVAISAPGEPPAGTEPGPSRGIGATATGSSVALDTVVLRFDRDAWVEIYDAAGGRLFYDLARAGRRVEVQGAPPLKVLLGYVDGVQIEYNGAPFDFSPYVSRGIARFELGR